MLITGFILTFVIGIFAGIGISASVSEPKKYGTHELFDKAGKYNLKRKF